MFLQVLNVTLESDLAKLQSADQMLTAPIPEQVYQFRGGAGHQKKIGMKTSSGFPRVACLDAKWVGLDGDGRIRVLDLKMLRTNMREISC